MTGAVLVDGAALVAEAYMAETVKVGREVVPLTEEPRICGTSLDTPGASCWQGKSSASAASTTGIGMGWASGQLARVCPIFQHAKQVGVWAG